MPFLIPERTVFSRNNEWLAQLTAKDVVTLAAKYTVARMLEREDFKTRFREEHPISVHEFLYPLYQAYDSVAIQADIEMGGDDQLFNLHVGRDIMRDSNLTPQIIFTMQILEGTDGRLKMSKSYGNAIALRDPPEEVFGKIMSLPDTLIFKFFTLLTGIPMAEIRHMEAACANGDMNPRDAKRRLASEVTALLHSKEAATAAQARFDRVFVQKQAPEVIESITLQHKTKIVDILVERKLATSHAEAKRLIRGNGVTINGETVTDVNAEVSPGASSLLKVGKRRFLRII
ncbi:MAG: tyrosine--tRNA ligase [Methyloceanibacter sp.]